MFFDWKFCDSRFRRPKKVCVCVQATNTIKTAFSGNNCTLQNNTAGLNGGGISLNGHDGAHILASIVGSMFHWNEAQSGGGISVSDLDTLEMYHTIFTHNKGVGGGGVTLSV